MAESSSGRRSQDARSKALSARNKTKHRNRRAAIEDHTTFGPAEQTLMMLLAEPEIQLLMQADRVDVQNLMTELNAISTQLRQNASSPAAKESASIHDRREHTQNDAEFRPGVGIMMLNRPGEVFVARRIDIRRDAWQMPQGGINSDETPLLAALRELREEIGTNNVNVIAESKGWFYYDVPTSMAHKAWAGKWRGQRQKWFVMFFKGQDSDINLAVEHPEFDAWRWISLQQLSTLAVSFKRQLYVDVMGEFATIFRD